MGNCYFCFPLVHGAISIIFDLVQVAPDYSDMLITITECLKSQLTCNETLTSSSKRRQVTAYPAVSMRMSVGSTADELVTPSSSLKVWSLTLS